MADRYTYLPLIGIAVALVWARGAARAPCRGCARPPRSSPPRRSPGSRSRGAPGAHWRDSLTLFGRAVAVTRGNWLAEINLGAAYGSRGDHARALEHFEAALRIRPDYPAAAENARRAREALAAGR